MNTFSVVAACTALATLGASASFAYADATDSAIRRYVSRTTTLSCNGLEVFDFLLESATVIGEWCREQNNALGDKGCGVGTSLCVQELMESDLPGGSLTVGLSATTGFGNSSTSGTGFTQSEFVWNGSSSTGSFPTDWNSSGNFNYVELQLSVGVDIPLGSRKLRRVTCVNPLDHDYVRMLAENVVLNNEHLKTISTACRLRPR